MPTMSGTIAEQVARPGGKTYRARKPPSVEVFENPWGDDYGIVVERTHDVDLAVALAAAEWDYQFVDRLPVPRLRWLRLVPWGVGVDQTYLSAEPGERNAFPAVEFRCQS